MLASGEPPRYACSSPGSKVDPFEAGNPARAEEWSAIKAPRMTEILPEHHATAYAPATPREKGSVEGAVRYLTTRFWPARRIASLADLDERYAACRERVCDRRLQPPAGATPLTEQLAEERAARRPPPPACFDYAYARASRVPARASTVPPDGYLPYPGFHLSRARGPRFGHRHRARPSPRPRR